MVRKYQGPLQPGKRSAYVPGTRAKAPKALQPKIRKKNPIRSFKLSLSAEPC